MLKIGKGSKTFFLVAEVVNMGTTCVDIKLTDNEGWAKQNQIFRVRDMTR